MSSSLMKSIRLLALGESLEGQDITLFEFIIARMNYYFVKVVPVDSLKTLPKPLKYSFGLASLASIIVTFVYFIVTSFNYNISKAYISLYSDSGVCESVSKPVSGLLYASTTGYWEGQADFENSLALYLFNFNNMAVSQQEYAALMGEVASFVNYTDYAIFLNNNLAVNLIYLIAGVASTVVSNNEQVMVFAGDAAVIFNRIGITTYLYGIDEHGKLMQCRVPAWSTFDSSTSLFTVSYPYLEFIAGHNCSKLLNPELLNYFGPPIEYSRQTPLEYELDMNSYSIALAINIGALGVGFLEAIAPSGTITSAELTFVFEGIEYEVVQLYDIRYPGMVPIMCLFYDPNNADVKSTVFLCFVELSTSFFLPIFNSLGANYSGPEFCNCSTNGRSAMCNEFDFLISLLYFNNYTGSTVDSLWDYLFPVISMYKRYLATGSKTPYLDLSRDAFIGQWYCYDIYAAPPDALAFCGFKCSMLTTYAHDYYNQAISQYYYQLRNGSCSLAFADTNWDLLMSNPPTALSESYVTCTDGYLSAFADALSLAFADTSALLTIMPLVFIPIVFFALKGLGYPAKESSPFNDADRHEVLEHLANAILTECDDIEDDSVKERHMKLIVHELVLMASQNVPEVQRTKKTSLRKVSGGSGRRQGSTGQDTRSSSDSRGNNAATATSVGDPVVSDLHCIKSSRSLVQEIRQSDVELSTFSPKSS